MNITAQATRLPIFISYGHKSHEETVLKIKEALEARGHKIWIDTEGIKEGTDWRRQIYDGILNSRLFLAFVSQKSIDSEYCQTEIRIAVGAPQNLLPICPLMLENVEVPKSISHIQVVNFLCKENDPSIFEKGMKSITDWIDRDEHFAFCQEMEILREKLGHPESFEARLRGLMSQPFVGREWLLEKINKWDQSDSRLFGIIGGPGFGKSIFAANLRSLAPEKVAAAQFIEWDKISKYAPKQIIKSLAFQLAARITQYRELLIDAVKDIDLDSLDESSLFDKLLNEPLAFENPNNTYWVILDALDEASAQDGQNPFVQTLMRNMDQLPAWLKFIVTSRPDAAVVTYLKSRGIQLFDTDAQIQQWQHEDMMEYLHKELKEYHFDDDILEDIINKSQGMFLYLHFICQDIRQNNLSVEAISQLPDGIDAIYLQYFERQFRGDRYAVFTNALRPVLRLYYAALEPLSLDFLAEALGENVDDVRSAIDHLGTLKTYSIENGREYFNLVHKSIWDWLARQSKDSTMQNFRVAHEDGLPALKEFCLEKIDGYKFEQLTKDVNCEYPLKHIIEHLIAMNDLETIWELLGKADSKLSLAQQDYWENSTVALSCLRKAIAVFWDKFEANPKRYSSILLPRISRLMVNFANQKVYQQKYLRSLFNPGNSLKKILKIIEALPDAKTCYNVGCYLLKKATNENWDINELISALERRCKDYIDDFNVKDSSYGMEDFLGVGSLREAAQNLTATQLIRILNIAQNKHDCKNVCSILRENVRLQQTEDAYWWFDKLLKHKAMDICINHEIIRIKALDNADCRCTQFVDLAITCYVNHDTVSAREIIESALSENVCEISSVLEVADYLYHTGGVDQAQEYIVRHEDIFKSHGKELYFDSVLCEYGLQNEAYRRFENQYLKAVYQKDDVSFSQVIACLEEIPNTKVAYMVGCYLLKKVLTKKWDVDAFVESIVKKSGKSIEKLDDDERGFLVNGPLKDVVQPMERAHIVRLLSVIQDRDNIQHLAKVLHLNNPCFQSDYLVWHFKYLKEAEKEQLWNPEKLEAIKASIENIPSDTGRCGAKCETACKLFTLNKIDEVKLLIRSLYHELDDNESYQVLCIFLELCYFMGESGGVDYYCSSRKLSDWLDYDATLCRYAPQSAYKDFEYHILSLFPDTKDFLIRSCPETAMLKMLAKSGNGKQILYLSDKEKLHYRGFVIEELNILKTLIDTKQLSEARDYLHKIISEHEKTLQTYRRYPQMLAMVNELKELGFWEEKIPSYQELMDDFFKDITHLDNYMPDDMLSDDFPHDIQSAVIKRLWDRLSDRLKDNQDYSSEETIYEITHFGRRLSRNPQSLKKEINFYLWQYMEIIKKLPTEKIISLILGDKLECMFYINNHYIQCSCNGTALLAAVLTDEQLMCCISWLSEILLQSDLDEYKLKGYYEELLVLCAGKGFFGKTNDLLRRQPDSLKSPLTICDVLSGMTRGTANWNLIPDNFVEFVAETLALYNDEAVSDWYQFAQNLQEHQKYPIARECAGLLLKKAKSVYQNTDKMFSMLKSLSVFMTKEQIEEWLDKLDSVSSRIEFQLTWLELTDNNMPADWFESLVDRIKAIDKEKTYLNFWVLLGNICINRDMKEQAKYLVSYLNKVSLKKIFSYGLGYLSTYAGDFGVETGITKLFMILKNNLVNEEMISAIMSSYCHSLQNLTFCELGKLACSLVDEHEYITKWFESLSEKLAENGDFATMKEIALACPELEISYIFEEPAVAISIDDILELRRQLSEEEITRKGYNKKIADLLVGVPENIKIHFEELEQQLDEDEITAKGYAKKLAEFF